MTQVFRVHGLNFAVPFPLSATTIESENVDWTIVEGLPLNGRQASTSLGGAVVASAGDDPIIYSLTRQSASSYIFRFTEYADVHIELTARRISWHLHPGADPQYVPLLVGGNVIAAVCLVQGLLALHASAVDLDDTGIAFIGNTGAGKSTLAAMACLGGARLITDDILRIDVATGEPSSCYRGANAVRLREGSRPLVPDPTAHAQSIDDRLLMMPTVTQLDQVPLRLLVFPRIDSEADRVSVTRIGEQAAALKMLATPRIHGWKHELAGTLFERLMDLAQTCPAVELVVPHDFQRDPRAPDRLVRLLKAEA